jgi:hypothetical protein
MVDDKIQKVERVSKNSETLPNYYPEITIGQWYWVKYKKDPESNWIDPKIDGELCLECVIHVGSNYVEMSDIYEACHRIHLDEFYDRCKLESDPESIISKNTKEYQAKVQQLMGRVLEVTARLGVSASPELPSGSETMALATVEAGRDFGTYKTDLVKAKEELLPELFKEIEETNKELVHWMKARVVPFKAQVGQMRSVIGRIDDRIFNVELYAGLTEKIEQFTDGEPAPIGEKIRLLQRRCYMDEECLARYETGGMEFKNLYEFDAWLARPANRDRLLPFPRCIVSFRVRRDMKERSTFGSFIQLMQILDDIKADTFTFLYIRNGDRLYRMNCGLDFGEKLFPDMDHQSFTGKLWAKGAPMISSIITDDQFLGLQEDYVRRKAEHKAKEKEHKINHKAWKEAKAAAKKAKQEFKEQEPWFMDHFWDNNPVHNYQEFEPNNIYYDDIRSKIASDIQHHNRIGLIIQGLLDRSPILHPHPPWKIWSAEGFREALELIYDESRALVAGEKPDFEVYRQKLNSSLQSGSITVGQEVIWEQVEADKMNDRDRDRYRRTRYRPYGNPGPGVVAKIFKYDPRTGRCTYSWYRDGQSYKSHGEKFRTKFACDSTLVFNVDAYKPGDFHQFFDDPRTRTEYLKWAPLMLEAEEYHAGNRAIVEPAIPLQQKPSSYEGRRRYERKRLKKLYMHKAVTLRRKIETKSGNTYEIGTLWRVIDGEAGTFTIKGILKDGSFDGDRYVIGVSATDITFNNSIPNEPKKTRRT